jgi:hypothetical protein
MNRQIYFLFFLLVGSQLSQAGRANCDQMSCGAASCCNDYKIGAVCYNAVQYQCQNDNNNNLVLCAKGAAACNGACYDPKNYHCVNNALAQGAAPIVQTSQQTIKTSAVIVTPKTSEAATPTPSSASNNNGYCKSGTCPSGLSCCGQNQCYVAAAFACTIDYVTSNQVLCPLGFSSCKGGCYNPNEYHCTSNGLAQGRETQQQVPVTSTTQQSVQTSSKTTDAPVKTQIIVNPIPVPTRPTTTQTADLRIINSCKYTLWFEGRYGGKGIPIPGFSNTSIKAVPGAYVDYTMPATGLSGTRFWAKYGCDANGRNCKVGDQMQYYPEGGCPSQGCTAPIDSLFEATFGCKPGSSCASSNPTTWFDTSQVDGYTIPYKVTLNGEKNKCDCSASGCGLDTIDATRLDLSNCPSGDNLSGNGAVASARVGNAVKSLTSVDLRMIDTSSNSVLGCFSPCKKMSYDWGMSEATIPTLYYCCPTPNPANCKISEGCISSEGCRTGPVINSQYVNSIHQMAPGIYTYAYDDGVGLHACPAGTVTYTMEFCPAGSSTYPHPL